MSIKRIFKSGYLLAFLATLVWSGNFVVARGLNSIYTPVTISFLRWGIAAIVIFPLAYSNIKRDWTILKDQWVLVLFLSFIGVALFNTFIYTAAHTSPALNLSLIAITAPLYVVLLNRIIFKEQLIKRQVIGIVILFTGLLMLISKGSPAVILNLQFNKGDLLMAIAAMMFGLYSVLLIHKKGGNFSFVASTIIIGELMLLPFFLWERFQSSEPLHFTLNSFLQLLYVGVGPSIVSFYLWNRAIASIGSTKASVIYNTIPIYAALLAFLFLDEPILPVQILSSVVIVAGIMLVLKPAKQ